MITPTLNQHLALAERFARGAEEVLVGQPIYLYSQPADADWPADDSAEYLNDRLLMHAFYTAIAHAFRFRNFTLAQALIMAAVDPNSSSGVVWPGWMYETLRDTVSEEWLDAHLSGWRQTGEIGS